jgi:exoribonuclease-2
MREKEIVLFRYRKGLRVGRFLESEREKVRLATEKDRAFSVPRANILFATDEVAASQGELDGFQRRMEALAGEMDLGEVWELVREDSEALSFKDIAELYWEDSPEAIQYAAVLWHLHGEAGPYFQVRGDLHAPAAEEEVEEARNRLERQRLQAEEEGAFLAWLSGRDSGLSPENMSSRQRGWLERLEDFAVLGDEYPQGGWVKALLGRLGERSGDPRWQTFKLLVERQIFSPEEHLALRRLQVPVEFPEDAAAAAEAFDPAVEERAAGRRDLRDRAIFSIDDATTADIDDAFSLSRTASGYRLGIHITDLSEAILPGSVLDEVARQRVTSLYFPETKIPMLPDALSAGRGSLREGEDRLALSLLIELDSSLEPRGSELALSAIVNRHRLTYDEVDEILAGSEHPLAEDLKSLRDFAERCRQRRIEAGALEFDRPEFDIQVDESGDVEVEVRARQSGANRLVAELMILYNVEVARFCREHDLPVIYRAQAPVSENPEDAGLAEPVRRFRLLKSVAPAALTLEPEPHHLLGVELYCQVSSPLRRYFDLVLQRQIAGFLRGGAPAHSRDEVTAILYQTDERYRELSRLENDRERYWFLKYLSRFVGKIFDGVLLDTRGREGLLELDEYPFRAAVALGGEEAIPGQRMQAELVRVAPWESTVRFAAR